MKRSTTAIALALATLAVAATGSLAGPTAKADAYYLRSTDYLHFPAWAPNGQEFHTRNLRLREGYYLLGGYFANQFHRTDPDLVNHRIAIFRPGIYKWMIHRWWGNRTDHYYVQTRLIRSGVGGGVWDDPVRNETGLLEPHNYGDGWYEWGGRMVWDGPLDQTNPQHPQH
jgi:hypothetical protein